MALTALAEVFPGRAEVMPDSQNPRPDMPFLQISDECRSSAVNALNSGVKASNLGVTFASTAGSRTRYRYVLRDSRQRVG
jgi:hypothetical protein